MNKYILKTFGFFLRLLQIVITKVYNKTNPHIIIGSSAGTNINGNSKALFVYMYTNETSLKAYFISRNKKEYRRLKSEYPNHAFYAYSFSALSKVITCRAFVITHGPYDVTPFKCTNTGRPLINVWHGFPIKKLGTDSHFLTEKQKSKVLGDFEGLVVMSDEEAEIMSKCYHTKPENMWVTGYPRNDFSYISNEKIIDSIPYIKGKKVLMYAPTFRDSGKTRLFPFDDFDADKMIDFLVKNNSILLLRIHKNELIEHNLEENEWIRICDGNVVQEINELMSEIDLLITDYSSSYIDRLLIDKPTLFIPYDLEWFAQYRGLNFDYNEVTPGAKTDTFDSFLREIKNYLDDPSRDSEKRQLIKNRFHKNPDNQSSKRVYDKIENLLA